jgi:hypothetical protein
MTAVELEVFTKLSGKRAVSINQLQNILEIEQRPTELDPTVGYSKVQISWQVLSLQISSTYFVLVV